MPMLLQVLLLTAQEVARRQLFDFLIVQMRARTQTNEAIESCRALDRSYQRAS